MKDETLFLLQFMMSLFVHTEQAYIDTYVVLAGAPDTTYRLITTNPGFQLQRMYLLPNTNYMNNIFKPVID
jgi:hypothetical protein